MTSLPTVDPVSEDRFQFWIRRKEWSLVFVHEGRVTPRAPSLLATLAKDARGELQAGRIRRDMVENRGFWNEHFRTAFGPYVRTGGAANEGVYLFHRNEIVGHHPGPGFTALGADAWTAATTHLAELMDARLASVEDDSKWTWHDGSDRGSAHASQSMPMIVEKVPVEAYERLKVSPGASEDEIRKAYKQQVRLNHPDRCRNLSPEIQAFAAKMTREVVDAWQAIAKARKFR